MGTYSAPMPSRFGADSCGRDDGTAADGFTSACRAGAACSTCPRTSIDDPHRSAPTPRRRAKIRLPDTDQGAFSHPRARRCVEGRHRIVGSPGELPPPCLRVRLRILAPDPEVRMITTAPHGPVSNPHGHHRHPGDRFGRRARPLGRFDPTDRRPVEANSPCDHHRPGLSVAFRRRRLTAGRARRSSSLLTSGNPCSVVSLFVDPLAVYETVGGQR